MSWQTYQLVLHTPPDYTFLAFVFFATLCSYSFHWYLTPANVQESPRVNWMKKYGIVHSIFFLVGLAGVIFFGISLIQHWKWLVLSAFITFLYSAPKIPHPFFKFLLKVAIGKTFFLAFVWMYVTSVLPLQISEVDWKPDFYLFAAGRFCLIYAICVLFDYRDRHYDRLAGIRSLITWLSERAIAWLFTASLVLFFVLRIMLINYGYSYAVIIMLLIPGILTGLLYRYATKNFSDLLYYFVLDSLMCLSSVLTLATIS
jgi:4-hydroxybenzoate polyprenyltransferase